MVIYTHIHDVTIARFATDTNSEQTDRQKWYNDYYNYFNAKLPLVDTRIITKCVYNVIKNIKDFNAYLNALLKMSLITILAIFSQEIVS